MPSQNGNLTRREVLKTLASAPVTAFLPAFPHEKTRPQLYFSCSEKNDIYGLASSSGVPCSRYDKAEDAVARARGGSGVLILADDYPHATTQIASKTYADAARKHLRLYVEFPAAIPGMSVGEPQHVAYGFYHNILDRGVVASEAFEPALKRLRILALHDCTYVPVEYASAELVLARVAGFNTAVFGLPREGVHPVLFKHPDRNILIATTKLSSFITGRYDPPSGWIHVWRWILHWLTSGETIELQKRTPAVHPAFGTHQRLPENCEAEAFRKGVAWFLNAKLFVAPQWKRYVTEYAKTGDAQPGPKPSWPLGDGSDGVLEGFSSTIQWNGTQPVGWNLRNDCAGETSMAMAFSSVIEKKPENGKIAANLNDFIYFNSPLASGPRNDPKSPSFGLVGWALPNSPGIYYGDDNARSLLGTMATAGLLKSTRWNEKVLRCLVANLRTTGVYGFRPNRLTEAELQKFGWRHFYDEKFVNYHPHFEAYPWACYLRAYDKTHYSPFLDRTRTAIRMTMAAYPNQWRWTNGFQQERARMLLPLAWLIRVEDNAESRRWLRQIATDLLAFQADCGGIREELGSAGKSAIPPPQSNEKYGTSEAPLLQENGDPVCDLLYTTNFAFLGLHEAAAATGDPLYTKAANKLAGFLCRVQIASQTHPELAGGWFRAFDYGQWDYWASASDWGWGPWSIETGWTQSWICAVMAMRRMRTSLWDVTGRSDFGAGLNKLASVMFG